ncbi:MAG TPA: ATP-grasp domain-containing protein [Gaiellales bacterium]
MAGRPGLGADGTGRLTRPRTLVVLGGGPAQRHAIDAARALGVRTIVCDADPRLGDVPVSSEDADGVRETARAADGLIAPGTDWPVRIAATAAEELHIPHPVSAAVAITCTDKLAQRARLSAAGVPQPRWSADAPPAYPCVVKAADRQGQRAMTIVRDEAGLPEAAQRARSGSRSGRAIYEEFVPGPEVTVNAFSIGGRFMPVAVTDRVHFEGVTGVARRHIYPAAADGAQAAMAVAEAAVAAVGIRSGPSYVQLILADDGPRVVEVAARLGGGHDSEICRTAVGVDLATAAVRAALAEPIDPEALRPHPNGAAVIEFLAAPPGELVAATGPPEVCFYDHPGHVYGPLRVATDRAGYVLATGPDRAQALRRAAAAVDAVTFEVR